MTDREWAIVTTALTDLFDIAKETAPTRINADRIYAAGVILNQELMRIRTIRANKYFLLRELYDAGAMKGGITSSGMRNAPDWQKKNEELEKKKEAQHAQDAEDLTQALKLSIQKIQERKEE
jgi:hypothetical protein